jgi:hypothetical protein
MNNSFNQQAGYYTQPVMVPGLKVAYGVQPAQNYSHQTGEPKKGWLGRLKNTVMHMVTEEAEADRPIGIAQLSKNTFLAHPNASTRTMVQSNNPLQDYRFRFITESRSLR